MKQSLLKSSATVGIYTLISRLLGFVRDVTIAHGIGASALSDAFLVAFKLPNFLRRLFAEGAFSAAFVPMFAGMVSSHGDHKAKHFASETMSFLLMVLLAVSGIFILCMPWVVKVLAPGFGDDPAKFDLTVTLTRITMGYIIFISLVSLLGGILNSYHRFAAVAATPIIMNVCLIIVPWLIEDITPTMAHGLAWAVLASGVAQWLWLVYFCAKQKLLPRLVRPRLSDDVRKLLKLIAPVAMGAGVVQINLVVDTIIASHFGVGVSYIYYADRINELPLAMIGIALGTVLLPMLARQLRAGDDIHASATQMRAIEVALFFSLPAAIALFLLAGPVISVLYERGAFTAFDAREVSRVLMAFSVGLPAFILVKVLTPAFYARQDTKTPLRLAVICVLINLVLNFALMIPLQYVGMAVATSVASWVNVIMMVRIMRRRGWLVLEVKLLRECTKIVLACIVMAIILWLLRPYWVGIASHAELERFILLGAVIGAGLLSYFLSALAINAVRLRQDLRRFLF